MLQTKLIDEPENKVKDQRKLIVSLKRNLSYRDCSSEYTKSYTDSVTQTKDIPQPRPQNSTSN